MMIAEAIDACL